MMTGNIHGIALYWGFIVLPWLMFFPGIKIATKEDVKGVDWSMVFFCIACLSIGTVSSYLGIGELVAQLLVPVLFEMNSSVVLVAIYAVVAGLNLLLTPLAILAGVFEPIAQIAAGLGMNPVGAMYTVFLGADQPLPLHAGRPLQTVLILGPMALPATGVNLLKAWMQLFTTWTLATVKLNKCGTLPLKLVRRP